MARTNLPVTTLSSTALTSTGAGTTIVVADGAEIAAGGNTGKLILRVTNTNGSPRVFTVKAGDNPPSFRAGLGDLAITVPATTGDVLLCLESARFTQDDGKIHIDFAASFAGAMWAWRVPADV